MCPQARVFNSTGQPYGMGLLLNREALGRMILSGSSDLQAELARVSRFTSSKQRAGLLNNPGHPRNQEAMGKLCAGIMHSTPVIAGPDLSPWQVGSRQERSPAKCPWISSVVREASGPETVISRGNVTQFFWQRGLSWSGWERYVWPPAWQEHASQAKGPCQ